MLEAFELDCFPLKFLRNIAACSLGCPSSRMRGENTDGTSPSRRRRAGIWKSSQLVIAPRCGIGTTTLSPRRRSIGLGISPLTWQEIEQEPNILEFGLGPVP